MPWGISINNSQSSLRFSPWNPQAFRYFCLLDRSTPWSQKCYVLASACLGGGFKHFLCSPPIWGRCPIWLIFFRWVETTNQMLVVLNNCKWPFFCFEKLPENTHCMALKNYGWIFFIKNGPGEARLFGIRSQVIFCFPKIRCQDQKRSLQKWPSTSRFWRFLRSNSYRYTMIYSYTILSLRSPLRERWRIVDGLVNRDFQLFQTWQ